MSKHLTFRLAREDYGLPIAEVREIIGMLDVTPVPRTPAHVSGVINLRGKIVPVIDLRERLGMEAVERTAETCIIVVCAHGVEMGIIVDSVSEVQEIDPEQIAQPPSFGHQVDTSYLLGVGRRGGNVQLLIDIDAVLSADDGAIGRAV